MTYNLTLIITVPFIFLGIGLLVVANQNVLRNYKITMTILDNYHIT